MERRKIEEGRKKPASHRHHQIGNKRSRAKEGKKREPSSLLLGESASCSYFLTTALLSKTKIHRFPFLFFLTCLSATHKTPFQKHRQEQPLNKVIAYLGIQDYISKRMDSGKERGLCKSYFWPGV